LIKKKPEINLNNPDSVWTGISSVTELSASSTNINFDDYDEYGESLNGGQYFFPESISSFYSYPVDYRGYSGFNGYSGFGKRSQVNENKNETSEPEAIKRDRLSQSFALIPLPPIYFAVSLNKQGGLSPQSIPKNAYKGLFHV